MCTRYQIQFSDRKSKDMILELIMERHKLSGKNVELYKQAYFLKYEKIIQFTKMSKVISFLTIYADFSS